MEGSSSNSRALGRKALAVLMSVVLAFGLNPVAKMPRAYADGGVQAASAGAVRAQANSLQVAQIVNKDGELAAQWYTSVGAAITAAGDGSTIYLYEDVEEAAAALAVTKPLNFNLQGHTVTVTGATTNDGAWVFSADSKITNGTIASGLVDVLGVKAGTVTLGQDLTVSSEKSALYAFGGGKVVVDGAHVSSTDASYESACAFAKGQGSSIDVKSGRIDSAAGAALSLKDHATSALSGGELYSGKPANNVLMVKSGSKATMTGGKVYSDDTADRNVVHVDYYTEGTDGSTFEMTGGEVSGAGGAGIAVAHGSTVTVGGTARVSSGQRSGVYVYPDGGSTKSSVTVKDSAEVSGDVGVLVDGVAGKATIEGGRVAGKSRSVDGTPEAVEVSGGAFSDARAWGYTASGKALVENGDEATKDAYPYKVASDEGVNVTLTSTVGTVGYATVADALAKAGDGDTVSLYRDTAEDVAVPAGRKVVLDLAGKTLTNVAGDTVTVPLGAELAVKDSSEGKSGAINNITHGKAALYNSGTATLKSGTLKRSAEAGVDKDHDGGNSYYTVLNHGDMTVKGGTVENNGHFSSLFASGYYSYAKGENDAFNDRLNYSAETGAQAPTLTIEGGTFDGGLNTIKNDDNATATIKGGTFKNFTQFVIMNNHVATIEGGTFEQASDAVGAVLANIAYTDSFNAGNLTVKGGTFTAGSGNGALLATGGNLTAPAEGKGSAVITGGSFNGSLPAKLATGHALAISGGKFKADPSAYVGGDCAVQANAGDDAATYPYVVEGFDASVIDVDIVDHGKDGTLNDDKKPEGYQVAGERVAGTSNVKVAVAGAGLEKHYSLASADKLDYWGGFGIPFAGANYKVALVYSKDGYKAENDNAYTWQTLGDADYTVGEKGYTSIYFRNAKAKADGFFVAVKDMDGRVVATYTLDSGKLLNKSDLTYTEAEGGKVSGVKSAVEGDEVVLQAEAAEGFKLNKITYKAEGAGAVDVTAAKSFTMPATDVEVAAEFEEYVAGDAVAAPLNDHGADAEHDKNADMRPAGYTLSQQTDGHVGTVTLKAGEGAGLSAHYNAQHAKAHWVGIGVPYTTEQVVEIGYGEYSDHAAATGTDPKTGVDFTVGEGAGAVDYASAYWDNAELKAARGAWARVKDGGAVVAVYVVKSEIKDTYGISANAPEHGKVEVDESAVEGSTVTVAAKPADNYYLKSLTYRHGDGEAVDITATGTFPMPADDVAVTAEFAKIVLADAAVTLEAGADLTFTGSAIEPAVASVVLGGKTLTPGTDYTVKYVNNVNAGTAEAHIVGAGTYAGLDDAVKAFTIAPRPLTSSDITFEGIEAQTFTGSPLTLPNLVVKHDGKALKSGADYAVAYSGNTAVGTDTAVVTIVGFNNYGDSVDKTFSITKASISGEGSVIAPIDAQQWTGQEVKPALTVTSAEGVELVEGVDYVAAYANNVGSEAAGSEAQVTVVGKGSYTGFKTATFSILPEVKSLGEGSIDAIAAQLYTGGAIEPAVVVRDEKGAVLAKGADYTIAYGNNVQRGTATVAVTGAGAYVGELDATFEILGGVNVNLAGSDVVIEASDVAFAGAAVAPEVVVTAADGTVLTPGVEYTVSVAADAYTVGAHTATVAAVEGSGVTGSRDVAFKVAKRSMADVAIAPIAPVTFTGEAFEPALTLTNGDVPLVADTDYVAVYEKNTQAGTAVVSLVGRGNYAGTADATFEIQALDLEDAGIVATMDTPQWTGSAIEPELGLVNANGVALTPSADYIVKFSNNVNLTTADSLAVATVVGRGSYEGAVEIPFEIAKAAISPAVAIADWTYDAAASAPSVTGTFEDAAVTYAYKAKGADDSTYAAAAPTDAGDYTVRATVPATEHYLGATATADFTIAKAASKVTVADKEATFNGEAIAYDKETVTGSEGAVTYAYFSDAKCTKSVIAANVKNAGTYYVKATVAADANHEAATSAAAKITINKAANKLTLTAKTSKKKPLAAKAAKATTFTVAKYVTVKNPTKGTLTYAKSSGDGKIKVDKKTGKLTVSKGLKKGKTYTVKVKVTSAASTNYQAANKTVTLYVKVK